MASPSGCPSVLTNLYLDEWQLATAQHLQDWSPLVFFGVLPALVSVRFRPRQSESASESNMWLRWRSRRRWKKQTDAILLMWARMSNRLSKYTPRSRNESTGLSNVSQCLQCVHGLQTLHIGRWAEPDEFRFVYIKLKSTCCTDKTQFSRSRRHSLIDWMVFEASSWVSSAYRWLSRYAGFWRPNARDRILLWYCL